MKYKIKKRKKTLKTKYILLFLSVLLVFISTTYAMFSTNLIINGSATGVHQELDVLYINIPNSGAYPSSVLYGKTFTYTFTSPPTIQSVTMGGRSLVLNTDYTYANGTITVPNVTGVLVISSEPVVLENINMKYVFGDNIEFNGATCVNTNIQLFTAEELERDFEMTVNIDDSTYVSSQNPNTVFNCAEHNTTPFPGFTFRKTSSTNYLFKVTSATNHVLETNYNNSFQSIHLARTGRKLYSETNLSSGLTEIMDYSDISQTFNSYLVFGSDIAGNGNPFRYFKGELSNITVTLKYSGEEAPITLPHPSRTGYVFKGWYSDSGFTNKIGNGGALYNPTTENNILYAKWVDSETIEENDEYIYEGTYNFAQKGYIDTGMYLYSSTNIHKNFEMSFNINSLGQSSNNDVLMSAVKNVLRISNISNELLTLETTGNTTSNVKDIPNTITNVRIIRLNDKLYYSFNGHEFLQINSYNGSTAYSEYPLLFGAEYNANGNIQREFDGTLSNISVRYLDNSVTLADYSTTHNQLATVYSHPEPITFDKTNNIDTGIKLFDFNNYDKDFEISFDIDSFVLANNNGQATLVNSKYENQSVDYPGFVLRLDNNKKNIELTAKGAGSGNPVTKTATSVQKVKISRRDLKIYIQSYI